MTAHKPALALSTPVVGQQGFKPYRLAIPREGHVKGIIMNIFLCLIRADVQAHAHARGQQRDIALEGDRSRSLTASVIIDGCCA